MTTIKDILNTIAIFVSLILTIIQLFVVFQLTNKNKLTDKERQIKARNIGIIFTIAFILFILFLELFFNFYENVISKSNFFQSIFSHNEKPVIWLDNHLENIYLFMVNHLLWFIISSTVISVLSIILITVLKDTGFYTIVYIICFISLSILSVALNIALTIITAKYVIIKYYASILFIGWYIYYISKGIASDYLDKYKEKSDDNT